MVSRVISFEQLTITGRGLERRLRALSWFYARLSLNDYGSRTRTALLDMLSLAVMEEALTVARRVRDSATQGRMIACASVAAARTLGAPIHDADTAAMRCGNYYYTDHADDVYRPDRDDDNNGRRVRPRYR